MGSKSREQDRPKKVKLVRGGFSLPKGEHAAIDALKVRATGLSLAVKKSDVLRAGLIALQAMGDESFKQLLTAVPSKKGGRDAMRALITDAPGKASVPAAPKAATRRQAIVDTGAPAAATPARKRRTVTSGA